MTYPERTAVKSHVSDDSEYADEQHLTGCCSAQSTLLTARAVFSVWVRLQDGLHLSRQPPLWLLKASAPSSSSRGSNHHGPLDEILEILAR